jgi:hypothetical protein
MSVAIEISSPGSGICGKMNDENDVYYIEI